MLKAIHWSMVPLALWFTIVQPRDVSAIGAWAVELHSILGLIFVSGALIWWADYMRRGLASRPGPKLPPWARFVHLVLHRVLIWGLFGVALTGLGLGLTASRQLWAGGVVPIGVPLGMPEANELIGLIHSIEFYILAGIIAFHAGFHIWRHVVLRDNALRIMFPRVFFKYL